MAFEQKQATMTEDISFDSVLNSACQKLWDKHTQYSIRRLKDMDEELNKIEKELDQFLYEPFSIKMPLEK